MKITCLQQANTVNNSKALIEFKPPPMWKMTNKCSFEKCKIELNSGTGRVPKFNHYILGSRGLSCHIIWFKLVHNILRYPLHRQTDRQTDTDVHITSQTSLSEVRTKSVKCKRKTSYNIKFKAYSRTKWEQRWTSLTNWRCWILPK